MTKHLTDDPLFYELSANQWIVCYLNEQQFDYRMFFPICSLFQRFIYFVFQMVISSLFGNVKGVHELKMQSVD